ncbi:hypothetical protein JX266_005859 [Neoarthrinium moseri]|nr:hypothetical protein JX266_005859 [Neoarthrinium moseri]
MPPPPAQRPTLTYRRLNSTRKEIRLLELQPAQKIEDQVVCRLITVPLTEDLEFIGLSSLYGDPSETEKVVVNGIPLAIPENLAQALRHVRQVFYPTAVKPRQRAQSKDVKAPRWLQHLLNHVGNVIPDQDLERKIPLRIWLDVLCINQSDDKEKGNQVTSLAQIYGAARMVVGWLGLKSDTTDAGAEVLRQIDEAMPPTWGDPGDEARNPQNYSPHHEWMTKIQHLWEPVAYGLSPLKNDHWVGVADFQNRPYFHRVWILREIMMARYPAFMVGDAIVSWEQVLRLNRFLEEVKERESYVWPAKLKTGIYEWPLDTIHMLLDEFNKKRRQERPHGLGHC